MGQKTGMSNTLKNVMPRPINTDLMEEYLQAEAGATSSDGNGPGSAHGQVSAKGVCFLSAAAG